MSADAATEMLLGIIFCGVGGEKGGGKLLAFVSESYRSTVVRMRSLILLRTDAVFSYSVTRYLHTATDNILYLTQD